MNRKIFSFIISLIAIGVFTTFHLQSPSENDFLAKNSEQLFNLEAHWSQGNVVALIRHTERCDRTENICLDGKTGITINGMEEAIKIGSAYSTLLSEHTIIFNSPVKRTKQSANFMFGQLSVTKNWLRENCKESLLDNIFTYKEKKKNLILVTHSTCIAALAEKEGSKLFNMDLHGEETYGGSFFISIDSTRKKVYTLGYLDSQSLQSHQFNP